MEEENVFPWQPNKTLSMKRPMQRRFLNIQSSHHVTRVSSHKCAILGISLLLIQLRNIHSTFVKYRIDCRYIFYISCVSGLMNFAKIDTIHGEIRIFIRNSRSGTFVIFSLSQYNRQTPETTCIVTVRINQLRNNC